MLKAATEIQAYVLTGAALTILAALVLLDLLLCREWVKQNLPQLGARIVSIRWARSLPDGEFIGTRPFG